MSIDDMTRFERRVPPEAETLVTLSVEPASSCRLYLPGEPGRAVLLDADDRGIVRFYARAPHGGEPVTLQLDARGIDGRERGYVVVIGSDVRHTVSMSSPELVEAPVGPGRMRGPLGGDPLMPSIRELVSEGFPPRPDPAKSPALYSRWLRDVSQPLTLVDPRTASHPELTKGASAFDGQAPVRGLGIAGVQAPGVAGLQGPDIAGEVAGATSSNWCGAYYTHPTRQFSYIGAKWQVPQATGQGDPPSSMLVEWVGLDNAGGDLYQAGSGSGYYDFIGIQITTYFTWVECLPWTMSTLPNLAVAPGDYMNVLIQVADKYGQTLYKDSDYGGLISADNQVWYYVSNETTRQGVVCTYPRDPETVDDKRDTGFTGTSAEFIIERPEVNGSFTALMSFKPSIMEDCVYGDAQYGDDAFSLGMGDGQAFDGKLTFLTMVNPADHHTLATYFIYSVPDHADVAKAMIFLWGDYS
jgi:hypothetical protein